MSGAGCLTGCEGERTGDNTPRDSIEALSNYYGNPSNDVIR